MRNTSLLVAPAEPAIENDLPLDLSCNSRRAQLDDVECGSAGHFIRRGVIRIGGPPSPPRSPVGDDGAASHLAGYVAYHRHLMAAQQWHQHQRRHGGHDDNVNDDDDDDDEEDLLVIRQSDDEDVDEEDEEDSDGQPVDLAGVLSNPKAAYKKSLMKRYCKSFLLHIKFDFAWRFIVVRR